MRRLMLPFCCLILLFAFTLPAAAQDAPINLTLFVDRDSLTVYIPTQGNVVLNGLGYRVVGENDEIFTRYLQEFEALLEPDYQNLPTPVCFQLRREGSTTPTTVACNNAEVYYQEIVPGDVFWYSDVRNQARAIDLMSGESATDQNCSPPRSNCEFSFTAAPDFVPPNFPFQTQITPAVEGEILVVLAAFEQLSGTDRVPADLFQTALEEALSTAREGGVNARVGRISTIVTSREQAQEIADKYQATMVIWGSVDPAGLLTRYEIIERWGGQLRDRVEETEFSALASLDEVDIRIRRATDPLYVVNFTIGQLLFFDEQYDAALPFFDDAIALMKTESETLWREVNLAVAHFYRGYTLQQGLTADAAPRLRLEQIMAAYLSALELSAPDDTYAYAAAQNNLGNAYADLAAHDDPQPNLERAVAAYEEALRFHTAEAAPLAYATTQNNLGNAYRNLAAHDDPQGNLERAIAAYEEALRFRTAEAAPLDYAATQNNLGLAYWRLAEYDDPQGNLERAVGAFEEALRFRTVEVSPLSYAQTTVGLGIVYYQQDKLVDACAAWHEGESVAREFGSLTFADRIEESLIDQFCTTSD